MSKTHPERNEKFKRKNDSALKPSSIGSGGHAPDLEITALIAGGLPLIRSNGPKVNLSNEQLYKFIEFP